jgi:tetratricopeptide (TPR) repeat protein
VSAGCAARVVPVPAPAAPLHPEFVYPSLPSATPREQATLIENGWRFLQADNFRNATRAFQDVLKRQSSFHPAEAGLGYVNLAERNPQSALGHFDRALQSSSDYVPALVGRGQALLALNRDADALASFEAALKLDGSLTDLKSRVEVLRFRGLQANLARASAASAAGDWAGARAAYEQAIAASPDSAFLFRDLAIVERKAGETAAALEHLTKAIALDANDARAHAELGAILAEHGDTTGALASYEKARAIDPAEVPAETIARLRERAALAKLPAEFAAISTSAAVNRADLAALLGVRLAPLLAQTRSQAVVVTDVRNNWAREWIFEVVQAGLMETQPNYTFQPAAVMRRGDIAQTVSRVLTLIAARYPTRAKPWQSAAPAIKDVPPGHLSHQAASQAVASGVMALDNGAFQLLRPVSGAEAVEIVSRLEALARP